MSDGLWFDESKRITERRWWLTAHPPVCPDCGSPQVQLVAWAVEPADWRCRMCKLPFIYEPE